MFLSDDESFAGAGPAEMTRMKSELEAMAAAAEQTGSWLTRAVMKDTNSRIARVTRYR
jgi:hypothetical protein